MAGNPLVPEDSLPLKILPRLQNEFRGLEFRELEPTDDMPGSRSLEIIDTVIGIDKVQVIHDIDKIVTGKVYSLHDFDLGFTLKLLKKSGRLDSVSIIGVPAHLSEEDAYKGVASALRALHHIK